MRRASFFTVLLAGMISSVSAFAGNATVTIYPKQTLGSVNPRLFGGNQLTPEDSREEYADRGGGIWDPKKHCSEASFVRLAKISGLSVFRWPGGCAAHAYDWKKAVGSLADRRGQLFGLPEFLTWCDDTDSLPLLTIAVYWGTAGDAADLVEYLNAPNDGSNPNGGRDWAAIRAANGHPAPRNVVWFEYGNETYHGEHEASHGRPAPRRITPEEYCRRYLETRAAMRRVDSRIKLGAVLQHGRDEWTNTILKTIAADIDFGIDHTYLPLWEKDTTPEQSALLLQAATACGAQVREIYARLRRQARDSGDREDLTWAITEYNGHYVQNQPVPYRQTLANALRNAEHLRIMMQPQNQIIMANFRQFANGYWGMIQGYEHRREPLKRQANFLLYELYSQHFGTTLVRSRVTSERWTFEGAAGVRPRHGDPSPMTMDTKDVLPPNARWSSEPIRGVEQQARGALLVVRFTGRDVNYRHASLTLPAEPNTHYRIKGLIRTESLVGRHGACLQVSDARSWTSTRTVAVSNDVVGTTEWREVQVDYQTLTDTESITIKARRLGEDGGNNPVSGTAFYRVYSVRAFTPSNLGAVPDITANTATRADGTITAMLVNTNCERDNRVEIDIAGTVPRGLSKARAWLLSGPTPWATNLGRTPKVRLTLPEVRTRESGWEVFLPRHSMIALVITP